MLGVKLTAFFLVMEHSLMRSSAAALTRIMLVITTALFMNVRVVAQQNMPTADQMLNSGSMGTEFWIAIPPNELNPFPVEALEVYIASAVDTQVEVFDAGQNRTNKLSVKAQQVRTLSDMRGETSWNWEVRESETVVRKGVRITSPTPITVFVLNSKSVTTDGYMALPVSAWDTEYIAASYYDFSEVKSWAGGFVVVAKEPTTVNITLRGSGSAGAGRTALGKRIGDKITVEMDSGDVYMVQGDGRTRGEFDLTGSIITSNKPIGLLGFHARTTMPNALVNGNGRNHLVEMLPPTSAWGKQYATVELAREHRNNQGKGDMFRIVAKEDLTTWSVMYYDKTTKRELGKRGGLLTRSGDFVDITQSAAPTALVHGCSVWSAEKPILVVQYSCSSSWDGDTNLDPFMIALPSESQFVTNTLFQVPSLSKFTKHRLHLIVSVDTTDAKLIDNLKSITIDNTPIWNHPQAQEPKLLANNMTKGFYWTTIDIPNQPVAHTIQSNGAARFGGYAYGYGGFDAYGWSITGGTPVANVLTVDTLPPVLTITSTACYSRSFTVREERNIPNPPRQTPQNGDQLETGLQSVRLMGASVNLRLDKGADSSDIYTNAPKRLDFRVYAIDTTKPSKGTLLIRDWNNNVAVDTVTFSPAVRVDTLPPAIELKSNVGILWDYEISDKRTNPDPIPACTSDTIQVDKGLQRVEFDSLNMRLIRPLTRVFPSGTATVSATMEVIDITKAAEGCIVAYDLAGNSSKVCQQYNPTSTVDNKEQTSDVVMFVTNRQLVVESRRLSSGALLQVYDLHGKIVQTSRVASSTHYEELGMAPGVYISTLTSGGLPTSTIRFVIYE